MAEKQKGTNEKKKKSKMRLPVLGVMLAAIIGGGSCLGGGFGFGGGSGAGDGGAAQEEAGQAGQSETTPTGEMIQDLVSTEDVSVEETMTEETSMEETAAETIVSVSIVENDYFYENERISLEGLMEKLMETEEDVIVSIEEDNASLKAYKDLTEKLRDAGFSVIEKNE